jgi:hypothetical protein
MSTKKSKRVPEQVRTLSERAERRSIARDAKRRVRPDVVRPVGVAPATWAGMSASEQQALLARIKAG